MTITQSRTENGEYRWIAVPDLGGALEGKPWDGNSPRLAILDLRDEPTKHLAPSIRIEVRCRREDLLIENIVINDRKRWSSVKKQEGFRNKEIAAEAAIRHQLKIEGLVVPQMSGDYALMTLAAVTPETT